MEDDKLYQREILHEMAMSIGASLDMGDMLKACIPGILKRLDCAMAWVMEMDGECVEPAFRLPRNAPTATLEHYLAQEAWRPAATTRMEGRWVNVWELPAYGALALARNTPLPDALRHEIGLIAAKLAIAIHGCKQFSQINTLKQELSHSEKRWSFALEGGGDTVWDWNLDTNALYFSKGHVEMFGYGEFGNRTTMSHWVSLVHVDDKARLEDAMHAFFRDRNEKLSIEYRVRCKNGFWKWILTRGMVVKRSDANMVQQMIGTHTDITDRKEAEAEIHRLAFYDPLTNLSNRRLLQDRLAKAVATCARSGLYGALFFVDLDHFKALNDSRGHDVGDLLLVDVAQRLREGVRATDTVARQGGDEFVVVMEDLGKTPDEAAKLASHLGEKLRDVLAKPFNLNGLEYHCKTSIGVDLFHGQDSVESLFKHADLALYQAKSTGRGKLCFFDPSLQEALDRRSVLENALHKVIARDELRLYYQPQVDTDMRVIGAEALLRWQHPQRGLVPPDEFIPLAEDTGLILPIGRWVLETACSQIREWSRDPLTRELKIAVNVSARQFNQPDFAEQVHSVLATSGANPQRLKLELTESMMLHDVADTIAKMQAIKQLNVLFSMDDFGTGYSSLSYLTQLPLDQIKIDKAFVRNLPGSRHDETIARALITMGIGLDMNVIAEGVETESQRAFLEGIGCHAYQGYLFSRPLPIEAFEKYLRQ